MNHYPILSILTFIPLAGGVAVGLLGRRSREMARWTALVVSALALAAAAIVWSGFNATAAAMQMVEVHQWAPSLGIEYKVGIDGLGLIMVGLTALLFPLALLAAPRREDRNWLYYALVLSLETGLFGTFTALNFFHWFLFWELSLLPAFFLIRIWGGPGRVKASTQFFVYTMVGSVGLLLAFLAIYDAVQSFDFLRLAGMGANGELGNRLGAVFGGVASGHPGNYWALVVFFMAFLGFAVKVPVVPFHTWLPATYAESPTEITMLLTGVMSKMGIYGFLRILLPLFPAQLRLFQAPLLWLAVATIILSALAAMAQKDLKRILAYSSVNHLGYCLLGLFALVGLAHPTQVWDSEKVAALNGVLLQVLNHGITAGTLFCFVAFIERRSAGQRGLEDFGGLRKAAPVFSGLMGIALFASIGLPGLNGFVSEFLIFKGAFSLVSWAAAISVIGLLVTAVFLLTLFHRVFLGPLNPTWSKWAELTYRERWHVIPAIGLMFFIGLFPQAILGLINTTAYRMVAALGY